MNLSQTLIFQCHLGNISSLSVLISYTVTSTYVLYLVFYSFAYMMFHLILESLIDVYSPLKSLIFQNFYTYSKLFISSDKLYNYLVQISKTPLYANSWASCLPNIPFHFFPDSRAPVSFKGKMGIIVKWQMYFLDSTVIRLSKVISFGQWNCCMCVQSCPTLCDPMNCSPPGPTVHGIFQARILE